MTAFLLKTFNDRVEILSDGALYSPDGTVTGCRYKVLTSQVVPLAIVGSGRVVDINPLAALIISAVDVAASVDEGLSIVRGSLAAVRGEATFDSPMRLAIAAISETEGPVSFLLTTDDDINENIRSFELHVARHGFGQGYLPSAEEMVAQGMASGDSLETHGLFLFEHMRGKKIPNPAYPDLAPSHFVGGQLDYTVVHPGWYEHRTLHTWPDAVGEKIYPLKADAVAA